MAGMETMFATLLKAMGFDPIELTRQVSEFADGIQKALANIDVRFTRIETKLDKVLDKLDEAFPSVPFPASPVDETLGAVIVPLSATIEHKDAA